MNMRQVKELRINEGPVMKITDSLGNVLWQTPTEYRQLEYIKFSGNEYIQEDFNLSAKNRRYYLEYTCDEFIQNVSLLAQWDNTQNANKRRLYIARCNNASGQAVWYIGSKYATYDMTLNTKYKSTCVYTNASNNTLTYELKDSSDTVLTSGTLVETTTSLDTIDSAAALGTTKLRDNSGVISYGGYWVGKLYKFQKYVDSSNTLQNDQVPCQRKSDGVCGLYDLTSDIFYPMTGTIITDAAAGPTVNENPSWSHKMVDYYINATGFNSDDNDAETILQCIAPIKSMRIKATMSHTAVTQGSNQSGRIYIKDTTGYLIDSQQTAADTVTADVVGNYEGITTTFNCLFISTSYQHSAGYNYGSSIGINIIPDLNTNIPYLRCNYTRNNTNVPTCTLSNIEITVYY